MWTIPEFRIVILIGAVVFMAATAAACYVAQKIQDKRKEATK